MAVTLTSGCTFVGNSAVNGSGIYVSAHTTLTLTDSALSGKMASSDGGGIYSASYSSIVTLSGCSVFANTAAVAGGGVYQEGPYETGQMTITSNSAICDNQAPTGADLENLNALTVSHSAIASVDNQPPGATTVNIASTDSATALTSVVDPSVAGKIVFRARVLGAASGGPTPTGIVTLYDASNNVLDQTTLDTTGRASLVALMTVLGSQPAVHVAYSGDSNFAGSTSAPVIQQITYDFGGFLAPLSTTAALAVGRTVPIKFQLSTSTSEVGSLSTVASLQILDGSGNNVLTNAGSTALRYDLTSNQYVANWQTKGLSAGTYTLVLILADGTTHTKTIAMAANGSSTRLIASRSDAATMAAGGLLGGDVVLYVDNSNGDLTSDELTRIDDAVAAVDATLAPYGVTITEVSDPALANVTLTMHSTSPAGGYADGVLGCTTDSGQVTIIAGWNFYAGSDATQIGAGQYDFQTVVTHELGHVLGLGHSTDATSVMYATLDTGAVKRVLVTADLNVPDADSGACGLHVAQPASPSSPVFQPMTHGLPTVDWLFASLARPTLAPLGAGVSEPLTDSNELPRDPRGGRLPLWATSNSRAGVSPWESLDGLRTEVDSRLAQAGLDGNLAAGEAFDWTVAPHLWWTVM